MFSDSDATGSKDPNSATHPKPEPVDSDSKTQENSTTAKPHLFPNRELTLSYLCDPKTLAADSKPSNDANSPVERDFFGATTKRYPPDHGTSGAASKKPKVDSLNLSLGPPSLALSLDSSVQPPPPQPDEQQQTPAPIATVPTPPPASPTVQGAPVAARRPTYSAATRSINSDDYSVGGASMSYSYSVPFSHNPSCSLTRNSTENYEIYAGEGTNGSVHSRFLFQPVGDGSTVALAAPPPPPGMKDLSSSSFNRRAASGAVGDNVSFFPSDLPARPALKTNGVGSMDSGRNGLSIRPERIVKEIVMEAVPFMAQRLHEFHSDGLDVLREAVRSMIDLPERREELASLQRKLERRSDLSKETLAKANKTQLEILVAVKTGMSNFVTGKGRVPATELAEMFLLVRCRNLQCKSLLPVDDCDCKICSTKKGFCSACMCPVCSKFDCAANTCSWVGCDVCSHWCHADCALERNLIRPGPTIKGPMGTTEMQFHCLGCNHSSEMLGFVKEVFNCCAAQWGPETLMKELGYVRKIFAGSEDFEGKGLHAKAEEMLSKLAKSMISPKEATHSMMEFFKYGVTEFSVTGSTSKGILAAQASACTTDVLPLQAAPTFTPSQSTFNFKTSTSMLETKIDVLKATPKSLSIEPHFTPSKEEDSQSLETIVKCKEAESKLFQKLADDARREVENYRQIARAKSEKLEEEYAAKMAKLCSQETEEKRRKKLEELKMLENSHYDYHKMKLRMQAEITSLLERMEATKKMWV